MQKKAFIFTVFCMTIVFFLGLILVENNTNQLLGLDKKSYIFSLNLKEESGRLTFLGWDISYQKENGNWQIKAKSAFSCRQK